MELISNKLIILYWLLPWLSLVQSVPPTAAPLDQPSNSTSYLTILPTHLIQDYILTQLSLQDLVQFSQTNHHFHAVCQHFAPLEFKTSTDVLFYFDTPSTRPSQRHHFLSALSKSSFLFTPHQYAYLLDSMMKQGWNRDYLEWMDRLQSSHYFYNLNPGLVMSLAANSSRPALHYSIFRLAAHVYNLPLLTSVLSQVHDITSIYFSMATETQDERVIHFMVKTYLGPRRNPIDHRHYLLRDAFVQAAESGNVAAVKYLHTHPLTRLRLFSDVLKVALEKGRWHVVQYLRNTTLSEEWYGEEPINDCQVSLMSGDLDTIRYCCQHESISLASVHQALLSMHPSSRAVFEYLFKRVHPTQETLNVAVERGFASLVEVLMHDYHIYPSRTIYRKFRPISLLDKDAHVDDTRTWLLLGHSQCRFPFSLRQCLVFLYSRLNGPRV